MAEDNTNTYTCCCCLIMIILFLGFAFLSPSSDTDSNFLAENNLSNNTLPNENVLEILNYTNITINATKLTFVYYDHNTTNFNGCYGLNYSVIEDKDGNEYMLDHAETDILGEKTNYTFKYPNGIGIVFDNNTETEIYKNMSYYYVHEIRDDNNTVIKSSGNFTLHDTSHDPEIIPDNWLFVYKNRNTTKYEGDQGLLEVYTNNTIGNKERNVRFYRDRDIIGLAYASNGTFDYKYGFKGITMNYYNYSDREPFYSTHAKSNVLYYPNGTVIELFDMEDYDLNQSQKEFITDYWGRIDDVRYKQQQNAIYDAESDLEYAYNRYNSRKSKVSYYADSRGGGIIYTPNP